jgi:hypothetical protein
MAFQPFGYRFEISSPLPASELKSVIRARRKSWFDGKTGARGWIMGPFMCLWLSAFDRYGPMLFGRISEDGFGARITGRAGSDLNGLAMYLLLMPLMVAFLVGVLMDGSWTVGQLAIFGGLILFTPIMLWLGHKDRKDAEPLVRFLRDVAAPKGARRAAAVPLPSTLVLTVSGAEQDSPITGDIVHDALMDMGPQDFIVLQAGPEHYMQAATSNGGFIIEKREDSHLRHWRAVRRLGGEEGIFTLEETEAAFLAYARDEVCPQFLQWERMKMPN